MIEVRNINKSFDGKQVLKNISVKLEPGKNNLIIGQSGSGKTVLLKCLLGLHKVDNGEIFFDERNFTAMNEYDQKKIRQEIGTVFQGGALFDSMTVEENVMFPLNMFTNQTRQQKKERVNFCLRRVDLQHSNKLMPSEISGGMKKRVAIARAIVMNPRYLFCDEPNSGLDPKTSILIDQLISELTNEFKMTTVINTHDMNSVIEIGDKVSFIYKGNLWWKGTNKEILHADNTELNDFVFATQLTRHLKGKL
ncbi:MAG: ABC transporter ATP-binding protein [Bacteroidetes bacterium GWF2_43_63]|nr:MAG: ABC transporter ATP-binding protein [Bacteroidetes bacterium GWE2_42_42]OFY56302.1 MAG: ABC transporter ATP-binding protein [Bacteroidetes bacterium GWF2_43_63]HBG71982.1 ABC transporter ATP-binding protein [Bacteroidales bacterium]HCB61883.1 ABC transporter ATP-binding protein [Bacteroidales bacterium]HCY23905.1 ABC transporter ATP-binding protein [Bacteroidales bacterium]